jgi:cytochrome c1
MALKTIKTLLLGSVTTAAAITGVAIAAGGDDSYKNGFKMEHPSWSFDGAFGGYDREAMQRGYQVYVEVCRACHNLDHLAFRHLGDKGAPFYNPEYKNPNDNPLVKNIAAEYTVMDIDSETGDVIERPGIPADYFPPIWPNDAAARGSNGGALPPDLSLMVKARVGGADYLYNLLLAYSHPKPDSVVLTPGLYYNPAKEGGKIAMAPQLQPLEGVFEYQDNDPEDDYTPPEATVEQMAADLTEFLAWSADPKLEVRKEIGFMSMGYLLLLSILLWLSYKRIWKRLKVSEAK